MVYVIAEAGVDHEGSYSRALELLSAAVKAKADCFKIQYYQAGFQGTHRELPWLPVGSVLDLEAECRRVGIDFLITPHDEWALEFICSELKIEQIKIGGTDWHLLDKALATKKRLIVSTGGRSMYRIEAFMRENITKPSKESIDILHSIPIYPCPYRKSRLWRIKQIEDLKNKISKNFGIGYSDHTRGIEACISAIAMGARIIEKHLTLERDVDGRNDTFCSLLPNEWPGFVNSIHKTQRCLYI